MPTQTVATQTDDRSAASLMPIIVGAAVGIVLIFIAGFTNADVMHDLSHDQRHALAFPCH